MTSGQNTAQEREMDHCQYPQTGYCEGLSRFEEAVSVSQARDAGSEDLLAVNPAGNISEGDYRR